jgi:hypothetical protein
MTALTLSEEEHRRRMKKRAAAVIKHYPIGDDAEADANPWTSGMMDSRLLADEVMLYLSRDQAPEVCEWRINDDGDFSTSCGMDWVSEGFGDADLESFIKFCPHCGKRIKETT